MYVYEFAGFRLNARERELFRGEEPVPLTPRALDTLLFLVERAGRVVDKEALLRAVWPQAHVSEATLTQNVYTVRKALGEDGPRLIETIPRRGYRFAAPVSRERITDAAARRARPHEDAHRDYIRGRVLWNQRNETSLRKAIECFESALGHDGDYALALSGLADCHVLLPLYGSAESSASFALAKEAAERALDLDASSAEAHTSMAYVQLFYDWDFHAADLSFRKAIERNPGYATAYHWRSFLDSARGAHDDAIAGAMHALELEPLSLAITADLGLVLYFSGRYERAADRCRSALEMDSRFAYALFGLSLAMAQAGKAAEALAEVRDAVERSGESATSLAALGYLLGVAGHPSEARRILERIEAPGNADRAALVTCGLGDKEGTIERLTVAARERSRFAIFLNVWPAFECLRGEPGFDALTGSFSRSSA